MKWNENVKKYFSISINLSLYNNTVLFVANPHLNVSKVSAFKEIGLNMIKSVIRLVLTKL
jgi:hypothetical protein